MSKSRYDTGKGYKLISAYLRLKQQEDRDEIEDYKFTKKLKGFHLFCSIIFLVFIVDGFLPYNTVDTYIEGYGALETKITTVKVRNRLKPTYVPTAMQIKTPYGNFITYDYTGFEKTGMKIKLNRTPLFFVKKQIVLPNQGAIINKQIDFHSTFIFWPILILVLSGSCLFSKKLYGSPTLSVIVLLNIVPFFTVVYMT